MDNPYEQSIEKDVNSEKTESNITEIRNSQDEVTEAQVVSQPRKMRLENLSQSMEESTKTDSDSKYSGAFSDTDIEYGQTPSPKLKKLLERRRNIFRNVSLNVDFSAAFNESGKETTTKDLSNPRKIIKKRKNVFRNFNFNSINFSDAFSDSKMQTEGENLSSQEPAIKKRQNIFSKCTAPDVDFSVAFNEPNTSEVKKSPVKRKSIFYKDTPLTTNANFSAVFDNPKTETEKENLSKKKRKDVFRNVTSDINFSAAFSDSKMQVDTENSLDANKMMKKRQNMFSKCVTPEMNFSVAFNDADTPKVKKSPEIRKSIFSKDLPIDANFSAAFESSVEVPSCDLETNKKRRNVFEQDNAKNVNFSAAFDDDDVFVKPKPVLSESKSTINDIKETSNFSKTLETSSMPQEHEHANFSKTLETSNLSKTLETSSMPQEHEHHSTLVSISQSTGQEQRITESNQNTNSIPESFEKTVTSNGYVSIFSISKIGRSTTMKRKSSVKPTVVKKIVKKARNIDLKGLPNKPNFPDFDTSYMGPRFYKFLTTKLEPKYGIRTNREAVKIAEYISIMVKQISSMSDGYFDYVNEMKYVLRKKGIIQTTYDFYIFIWDYLPKRFHWKSIPMIQPAGYPANAPFDAETLFEPVEIPE